MPQPPPALEPTARAPRSAPAGARRPEPFSRQRCPLCAAEHGFGSCGGAMALTVEALRRRGGGFVWW